MSQVTVELPDALMSLPERERDLLIRAGLYEASRARIHQLEEEIARSQEQVERFERRYGVALEQFETDLLPSLDSHQAHEDHNDWFYWQSVVKENRRLLAELRHLALD